MKFFRIDGQKVVTAPIREGSDEEIRDACLCDHSDWEDSLVPDFDLAPDGIMQKCLNCSAIRYSFDELPDVGIEVVDVTDEEYRNLFYMEQQALLSSKFKRESV